MKGIVVTLDQFEKVPIYLRDRIMIMFSGKDKFHLMIPDNNEDIIGEIVCSIIGEKKLTVIDDNNKIKFCYPKWIDMT